jgi:hypothetical protein
MNSCWVLSIFFVHEFMIVWFFFIVNIVDYTTWLSNIGLSCIINMNSTQWSFILCFTRFDLIIFHWGFLHCCSGRILIYGFFSCIVFELVSYQDKNDLRKHVLRWAPTFLFCVALVISFSKLCRGHQINLLGLEVSFVGSFKPWIHVTYG